MQSSTSTRTLDPRPLSRRRLLVERVVGVALLRRIRAVEGRTVVRVQLQTLCQSLGQIGVGDKVTAEDDEVCFASVKLGDGVVAAEVAGSNEADIALGKYLAEAREVVGLGLDGDLGFDAFAWVGGVGGEGVELGLLVEDFVKAGLDPDSALVWTRGWTRSRLTCVHIRGAHSRGEWRSSRRGTPSARSACCPWYPGSSCTATTGCRHDQHR